MRAPHWPETAQVAAVGVDLVSISAFAAQLGEPGTRFGSVFTPGERRAAARRPTPAQSLAARWAAKEAVVKAWGNLRFARPDDVARDQLDLAQIEVRCDALGRTRVVLHGAVAVALEGFEALVSLSHDDDADVATAYVVLCRVEPEESR